MEEKYNFKIQDMVQWYEGQLLYPHHYQQMRHEIQQLSLCYLTISTPWYWGIHHVEIDEALLLSGIIRVNKILAMMPDGSVVEKATGSKQKIELDISGMKDDLLLKPTTIYLAVVERQEDAANTEQQPCRYDSIESNPIVDENTGDGAITMPRLSLKAFLVAGDNLPSRYSGFPLMQVKFEDDAFAKTDFIPPFTSVQQQNIIGEYLGRLIKNLRKRTTFLGERLQSLMTQDTASILEYYDRIYNIIVGRVVVLEALYFSEKCHPFEVYKELCVAAGTYCALHRGQIPPVFDPYDHNDLKSTFDPVVNFIEKIIEMVKSPSISLPFTKSGRVFERKLRKDWLDTDYLILGIKLGVDASPSAIAHWLNGAIIACDSALEEAKEKRILGPIREVVDQVSEMGLLATNRQLLVKVLVDEKFIKAEETLQILNPSDTENSRPEEIVLYTAG
ncbi:MAG: type VI secretion system baseplate subunit TssK [Alphaproteobacteria bacterium]